MASNFMKSRLCWLGKSYRLYLRSTSILQQQHIDALSKESKEVLKLLSISKIVPEDNEMGVYYITSRCSFNFIFSFLFFSFSFFLFCMLVSHNGIVTQHKVALYYIFDLHVSSCKKKCACQ
jgi:hypothetical protein